MHWLAVHHDLATNRKWIALPPMLRGAWISLLVIAGGTSPRGRLRDRATAAALLAREGFSDADALVADLITRGWIDEEPEGEMITTHPRR